MLYEVRSTRIQKTAAAFVKAQERQAAPEGIVTPENGCSACYGDNGLVFQYTRLKPALACAAAAVLAGRQVVGFRRVAIHAEIVGGAVIEYDAPTATTKTISVWEFAIRDEGK
jgi:hypothetical protein